MSETIRTFMAFDINEQSVLQKFSDIKKSLLGTGADLKPVETQNIHITMRFLGDVNSTMVNPIHEAMKKVSYSAFDCEIRGLGAFPSIRHANVVWAGITRGANELRNVFSQLEANLTQLKFRPDPKGFSPHLTLARVKSGRNKAELADFLQKTSDYEFGIVRADCLRLKKSVLTPKGPIYSTLREVCH